VQVLLGGVAQGALARVRLDGVQHSGLLRSEGMRFKRLLTG
jgi:hypothetical protein